MSPGPNEAPVRGMLDVYAMGTFDHRAFPRETTYYWRLEVHRGRMEDLLKPEGKNPILWSANYDRREFTFPAHTLGFREFRQRLMLPKGQYQVMLYAYDVRWELTEFGPELVSTRADGKMEGPMGSFIAVVR
jgi:hypothetical protein